MIVGEPQFADFEWDEEKRLSNLKKHGIDFIRAVRLMKASFVALPTPRNGEARQRAICRDADDYITVIFVMREQICRIISARKAHRSERRRHQALFD